MNVLTKSPVEDETHEQARLISRAALFSGVRASLVADLARQAFTQHLEVGDLLFREGDRGHSMYVLGTGRIRLFTTARAGQTTTLATLRPGATFGELAIFDRGPRSASAVAEEATSVVGLPSQVVRDAYRHDADLADNLLRSLAALVRASNSQRSTVVFWDLASRVSDALAALSTQCPTASRGLHVAEVAANAGGSVQAVLGILHQLEREGCVRISGSRVTVLNGAALAGRAS